MRMGMLLLPAMFAGVMGCSATAVNGDRAVSPSGEGQNKAALQMGSPAHLSGDSKGSNVSAACNRTAGGCGSSNMMLPPAISASSGQCWVQSIIRPKPVKEALDVVVRDAVNKLRVTPPRLAEDEAQLITKAGTTTYTVQPPVYRAVTERVEVKPEVRRSVVVPAVFEDVKELVVVETSRTELEPCKSAGAVRFSAAPVSALCARTIPAKTKIVAKKQLVSPEKTKIVVEPAEYKEVVRWVLETPARVVPVQTSDEMTKLRVKNIAQSESVEEKLLPAERKEIGATRYENEPKLVTVPAVCDADLREPMIYSLQTALKRAGFEPGALDGKLGRRTIEALLEYQLANGLAYGALTYESLEHLGVR